MVRKMLNSINERRTLEFQIELNKEEDPLLRCRRSFQFHVFVNNPIVFRVVSVVRRDRGDAIFEKEYPLRFVSKKSFLNIIFLAFFPTVFPSFSIINKRIVIPFFIHARAPFFDVSAFSQRVASSVFPLVGCSYTFARSLLVPFNPCNPISQELLRSPYQPFKFFSTLLIRWGLQRGWTNTRQTEINGTVWIPFSLPNSAYPDEKSTNSCINSILYCTLSLPVGEKNCRGAEIIVHRRFPITVFLAIQPYEGHREPTRLILNFFPRNCTNNRNENRWGLSLHTF